MTSMSSLILQCVVCSCCPSCADPMKYRWSLPASFSCNIELKQSSTTSWQWRWVGHEIWMKPYEYITARCGTHAPRFFDVIVLLSSRPYGFQPWYMAWRQWKLLFLDHTRAGHKSPTDSWNLALCTWLTCLPYHPLHYPYVCTNEITCLHAAITCILNQPVMEQLG